jgi:hypothetical protein
LWCRNIWVNVCMNRSTNKFFIIILLLWRSLFFILWLINILIWAPIKIICIIFILFSFISTFHYVCVNNSSISLVSFKKISFGNRWSSHLLMFWGRLRLCNYSTASIFSFCDFLLKKFLKSLWLFNNWNIINPERI